MMRKILMAGCVAAWSVSPLLADEPAEELTDAGKAPRPSLVAEASTTPDDPETAPASVVAEGPTTAVVARLPETLVVVGSPPMGGGGVNECLYKLKRDSEPKKGCEACPKKGDLVSSGDPCEDVKDCPKKYKVKKIDCPDGGPGFCKKIKGKRHFCQEIQEPAHAGAIDFNEFKEGTNQTKGSSLPARVDENARCKCNRSRRFAKDVLTWNMPCRFLWPRFRRSVDISPVTVAFCE